MDPRLLTVLIKVEGEGELSASFSHFFKYGCTASTCCLEQESGT